MPTSAAPQESVPLIRRAMLLKAVALGGMVMLIAEALRIFVGSNFHTVAAGQCYRSAQPSAAFLETVQHAYGIRTILNLRDENPDDSWYQQEKAAAQRLHIDLIDAGLSSKEHPPVEDFRKFIQAMKDAKEPILIHCANGNDRSGLAAAIYLLMRTNTSLLAARQQLSLRYGHIPATRADCLDDILDRYEAWLRQNGWDHNAERLYDWGMNVFRPVIVLNHAPK